MEKKSCCCCCYRGHDTFFCPAFADGSDEFECDDTGRPSDLPSAHDCSEGFYSCDDGVCLPTATHCDGKLDCLDSTDEMSCDYPHVDAIKIKGLSVRLISS